MSYRRLFGYLTLVLGTVFLVVLVLLAIRILSLETPKPPAPKTKAPYYVVRRGDTVSEIVERTGVPTQELGELNPELDPQALSVGERLRLRASAPPPGARSARRQRRVPNDAVTQAVRATAVPRPSYYVVKQGDQLAAIAKRVRVPVNRVIELNRGIRPNRLVPGQRINLRR